MANHRAHSSPEVDLPKRIGRHVAFHQIGAGGMARVYLGARKGSLGTTELVVIKQLRRDVAEDDQVLALFVDEARIAMRLDHPNVVRTREVVAEAPDYCLVMDFLDGQSLLHVLRRLGWHGVPRDTHIWILTQVLAGLQYAHELRDESGRPHGIVHRDVSPSNVLVCYTGEVKLLDFGIAKATGALAATHQGVAKGKVGYAAPEQCVGKPADPRSDLYSVGVMLWEAVAQRRRSSGETQMAILQGRIEDTEPPLERVCPDAHPTLVRICRRALARSPEARYATAGEFRAALEQYLAAQPRRTGPEDVAAVLHRHFEQDRTELRKTIEAYGIRPREHSGTQPRVHEPLGELPPPLLIPPPGPLSKALGPNDEDTSPIPVDDRLLKLSMRESIVSIPPPKAPSARPPPPLGSAAPLGPARVSAIGDPFETPRSGRGLLWFVAGVVVAAAAAGGFIFTQSRPSESGTGTPAAAAVVAPAAAATTGANPATSAEGAKFIKLRVAVEPRNAEVRLDGRLLNGNPYAGEVERDGLEHELTASADKHRVEKHKLRFDEDIDLELSLESSRGSRRAQIVRGGRMPVALPPPPAPAPEPAPAPKAEARPAPRIEPGMDLESRPSSRAKNKIDEKDPYAK